MVTRQYISDNRAANIALGGFVRTAGGGVLPVLGLASAISILNGQLNQTTASSLEVSSAGYGLTTSMYGLQDTFARALIPVIEEVTPILSDLIDRISDADDATDGWSTRIGLLGAAALLAGRRLGPLAGLAGAAAVGAQEAGGVTDDVKSDRDYSLLDLIGRAGARIGASGAAGAVTGWEALLNNDPREFLEFQDRNRRYREATDRGFDQRRDAAREDELRRDYDPSYSPYSMRDLLFGDRFGNTGPNATINQIEVIVQGYTNDDLLRQIREFFQQGAIQIWQ